MYYVILSADPDDCMGHRVKIVPFTNKNHAIDYYRTIFANAEGIVRELMDLYCWDIEDIEAAKEEDYNLVVCGKTQLFRADIELDKINDLTYDIAHPIEYNLWINDYDDLAKDNCCISIEEIVDYYDFELIYSYAFELIVNDDYKQRCLEIIKQCDNSLM